MMPVLDGLITLSAQPLRAVESDFAVDATGFSTSRFERWFDQEYGREPSRRMVLKAHAMTGTRTKRHHRRPCRRRRLGLGADAPPLRPAPTGLPRRLPPAQQRRDHLLDVEGHVRRLVEAKSAQGQVNEVLTKVLDHNICVAVSAMHALGIEPNFC